MWRKSDFQGFVEEKVFVCIEIILRKTKDCGTRRNGRGCCVKSMFLRIKKARIVIVSLVCSWWILPASWKVRQLSASSQHCRLFSLLPTIIFFPTLTTFDSGFLGHGICPGCYYFNDWVPWYCICIKPTDHIYGEVLEQGCLRHLRVWSINPVFSL